MVSVKIVAASGNEYEAEMDVDTRDEVLEEISKFEWFYIDDDELGQVAINSSLISDVVVKRRF